MTPIFYLRYSLVVVCCATSLACSSSTLNPDTFPYRLEEAQELGTDVHPADLDGDGHDELVYSYTPSQGPPSVKAIWLQEQDGQTIEQVNYEGTLLPLHFTDLKGDRNPEIIVPYVREDSLFVDVIGARGQRLFGFFLIAGKPRREPGGVFPWDPIPRGFYASDVNGDGKDELITIISAGFARLPRGVLVHALPDGQRLGQQIIGAAPINSFLDDFDDDGRPEVVIETMAPNNGAEAGGFDDAHSYIIAFDLHPRPTVSWSRQTAGRWSGTDLTYQDFDSDGQREFFAITTARSSLPQEAKFEFINPGTWRTTQLLTLAETLNWPCILDLNRDAQPEIVALREQNELWAFNTQFERTRRRRLDTKLERIETLPDVDGDGVDEIVGYTRLNKKAFLFTPDFHIKATYQPNSESRIWIRDVLRTGFGETPFLLAEYDNQTVALRLVPNRFYWFDRYGLPALLGFGLILIIGTVIGVRSLHRRKTLIERLHSITLDAADQGFLVLDPAGHITAANSAFRNKLGLDASAELDDKHYVEALSDASPFASFLDNSIGSHPPHHHNEVLSITSDGLTRTVQARIEPVTLPGKRRPYWFVSVQSDTPSSASEDAHTWAMMAKKVMHDIKNPLTNILLTAQRLQTEHHKRVPEAAPTLNSYPERIIERVTHLRRMTKQFMKVLDVDALDLVKTNPSTLVHDVHQKLSRDLPPDIKLVLDVQPDLPSVLVDREQMQSVLENLVTNAVHALPDGGTITISAYSVPNLCTVHSAYEPRDYTVLEVQDNGVGISEEDRPRLFEPGFTTLEFGTGLGLALIKKAVDHHNGFIEVESEPGVGSVFSVHLPFANTPP